MASKREQILWRSVWDIAAKLERSYGLIGSVSAGIYLLDKMPAEIQRDLVAALNTSLEGVHPEISDEQWRSRIGKAVADAQAYRQENKSRRQTKRPKSG